MCLWGLYHGRRMSSNQYQVTAPLSPIAPVILVPPNPRRVAVHINCALLSQNPAANQLFLYFGSSITIAHMMDGYHGIVTLKVEDWGSAILQEIKVHGTISGGATVGATDVFTNESDEQLSAPIR